MIFDVIERYHAPYVYVEKWRVKDFQLHFHTDIELSLVLSGSADFSVNHQSFTLHAGDIMLINRVTPHSITNPDACECIWLAINPSFCHSFFPSLSSVRFQENFIGAAHPLNAALSADIRSIFEFLSEQDVGYEFKLQELLNHVIYMLISSQRYILLSSAAADAEKLHLDRVRRILDYIELNYSLKPRLEDLADDMQLSPDYLSHFIKEAFGLTFREYLTKFRLRRALDLLERGPIRQLDLLLQTGFSDYRYFSRAFSKNYGCTPEEYMRRARATEA